MHAQHLQVRWVASSQVLEKAKGGVSAQHAHSTQLSVRFPVTTLQTTHCRGSYVHRAKSADLDNNLAFLVANIVCYLSFWTE